MAESEFVPLNIPPETIDELAVAIVGKEAARTATEKKEGRIFPLEALEIATKRWASAIAATASAAGFAPHSDKGKPTRRRFDAVAWKLLLNAEEQTGIGRSAILRAAIAMTVAMPAEKQGVPAIIRRLLVQSGLSKADKLALLDSIRAEIAASAE